MAKKAKREIGLPQVPPKKGIELIRAQIEKGNELLNSRPISRDEYSTWELITRNYLEKVFGENSPNTSSITDVGKYGGFPIGGSEAWWENHRAESLQTQLIKLGGLVELLITEEQLAEDKVIRSSQEAYGHRVFLVHGHDERVFLETASYLEKLGLEITILREQPNSGRTIIEKFIDYSDVGFAVILLTPDDRGGPINTHHDDLKPRARQNVIFELGYFIGRLGRNRVCALYSSGVEIPSDYSGVLYIEYDEKGAWRIALAKEMKAAGLPIDMNLAL